MALSNQPIIIDRRKNPGDKNLTNRQRFIERFRGKIQEEARKSIGGRSISDTSDQEITISTDGIDEPKFSHDNTSGEWDYILPGNKEYMPGDKISKPRNGNSEVQGTKGGRGEGQDNFEFVLSYDEYLDIIFDDLALPDLIKSSQKTIQEFKMRRAGFTTSGVPTNLNVERTAIAGISRRLALRSPKYSRISELELLLESTEDDEEKKLIIQEIEELKVRANAIGFLDNVDLRYNNFTKVPAPITQAVMFCIMDVSGSMTEREKIISKKFFILLYLFLKKQYKNIEVVFIKHHERAEECDEKTFFSSRDTGGTVVSSAYQKALEIIKKRYSVNDWNIYISQASDGDNVVDDKLYSTKYLNEILKLCQFMTYLEISRQTSMPFFSISNLWNIMLNAKVINTNLAMEKIHAESEIIQIFRKFFARTK